MHALSSRAPHNPAEVQRYINDLAHTSAYAHVRSMEQEQPTGDRGARVAQRAVQEMMRQTVMQLNPHESERFDPGYNALIQTLPLLRSGREAFDHHQGNSEANRAKMIEFNHAMYDYIANHPVTDRVAFRAMLESTMQTLHYTPDLIETVLWDIFPGMETEVVGEENLYHIPGNFVILGSGERIEDLAQPHPHIDSDRRASAEMRGIDRRIVDLDTGDELTIDFKRSKQAAIEAQADHERWLRRHHKASDNHLALSPGYREEDFVPGMIGRVIPEAREREQPRVNNLVLGKFEEIRQHRHEKRAA